MTKDATAAHAAGPYKAWSVRHPPSEQERWCIVTYHPARGMHWPLEGSEEYEYESDARRAADLLNQVHAEAARMWLPIEKAPKDGSKVLLYWPDVGGTTIGNWRKRGWWSDVHGLHDGDFYGGPPAISGPTHYMPLPAAPEDTDV